MIKALPKILFLVEIICLLVVGVGLIFKLMHWTGANVALMLSILLLATVYFFSAFVMVEGKPNDKPLGFLDLLPTILRKVLFIGLSVYCIGFLFTILHLAGAAQQMLVGLLTLAIGSVMGMALVLQDRNRMELLKAPLPRAILALLFHFVWPLLSLA